MAPNASAPPPPPAPPTRGRGCAPWLVGCGVVALIFLVLIAAAAWWYAVRPMAHIAQAAQDVARVERLDAGVLDHSPWVPPVSGELTADQVDRYAAVLRHVRDDLEGSYRTLEARYAQIDGRRPEWTDIPRLAGAYADFLGLLVEAKESQVAALNAQAFSLEEYAWVRSAVLHAAGLPGSSYDLGAFIRAVTSDGRLDDSVVPVAVPDANRVLVERFADSFGDLAFLAVLGL